ncbi:single-stranded-DNA-specific exonuclease RecJ [Clostridium hydrogenum]|uniref:single-stranded-DNA-specific exonuclease RecJ n=1 Tax=Clostridium hydrogenum TaxID=2855764 RepID=UPI001F1FFADF|nr:single-stranded-DNA-specific exonuclease RecJ [Clostridium hydrogenum]
MERWFIKNKRADYKKIAKKFGISEVVAKIIVNRDVVDEDSIKSFINPSYENLHNPREMKDLIKGVTIIKEKIAQNRKIMVVGDYDVDGVMSTYVLFTALKRCMAKVDFHIPDRVKEGYGINESIIRSAKDSDVDLIITCDNGISAIEQIKLAKELGIKVIVTDHHDIPFKENSDGTREFIIPPADAVINPKQKDCEYPCKSLCGAAVAFKFVQVLYEEFNISKDETYDLLQYVAIATVCDVVDLTSENKIIVKNGLSRIKNTKNMGLKALLKVTDLTDKEITVYMAGFVIGPCINASSRLEQAIWAIKLLLTENNVEAEELANKLFNLNKKRQELTNSGLEEAIRVIEANNMTKDKVLVVFLPLVHESIAGIIAGRIREKYNLPTIVLTKSENGAKGSGRSIEEFNMFEELLKCKDILGKFGGHPLAAGLSIDEDKIDLLREKLNENCTLSDEDIIPKVTIDMQLPFNNISMQLVDEINVLEPFGKGNSKPLFAERGVQVLNARILGKNKNVLKLSLKSRNKCIDGIMFEKINEFQELIINEYGKAKFDSLFGRGSYDIVLDFVFSVDINEYMGNRSLQLQIKSFRKTSA